MTDIDVPGVLKKWPDLCGDGISCGHFDGGRRGGCHSFACGEPEDRFQRDRAYLLEPGSVAVVEAVVEVLQRCRPTKQATYSSPGSYELKHRVERLLRADPGVRGYVSNGQLIVAALVLGVPVRRYGDSSPNVLIGLRKIDVRRLGSSL